MSTVHETIPEPQLLVETADFDIAERIELLDSTVKTDPEAFIQNCRKVSTLALKNSLQDGVSLRKPTEATKKVLKKFIDQQDIRHIDFDADSEAVIFNHPGTITGLANLKKAHSHVLRRGSRLEHVENPDSTILKNDLSIFKLFLYAKQVKQWQVAKAINTSDLI